MSFEKAIEKICEDYHVTVNEVMCKTSVHYATKVKTLIGYVLFTHYGMTREKIATLMCVHPYSVWRYKQTVTELIKKNPKLEDNLKKYKPSVW